MAKKLTLKMHVARLLVKKVDACVRWVLWGKLAWCAMNDRQKARVDRYDNFTIALTEKYGEAFWIDADMRCRGCMASVPEEYTCHKCGREPEPRVTMFPELEDDDDLIMLPEPASYEVFPIAVAPSVAEAQLLVARAERLLSETRPLALGLGAELTPLEDHRNWDTPAEAIDSGRAAERRAAQDWELN